MKNPLPSGPSSLCFNKEDFTKESFNVESFVVECRRRVALETLRDDLSLYLKILKSAMIELINKDYADFVNLSTNLVGMDKAINNLMSPLNHLRNEVLNVRTAIDEAVSAKEQKMQQKAEIRDKKACLQRLMKIIQCVEKMESLLGIRNSLHKDYEDSDVGGDVPQQREISGQLIERVATEFNRLQFFVNKSRGLPLVEEIRPRVLNITTTLQFSLEGSFKDGLDNGNAEVLRQCLRTYATIDKMRDAENLFRQHVIKPHLEDIITEQFIKSNGDGLSGMYKTLIDFIPKHCQILRDITSGNTKSGDEAISGYDFLVNSMWPEIVSGVEQRTYFIFAPGNPTVFHEKYSISIKFLEEFERHCGSQASVKRLRGHPSYNTFMTKWSLPVYFQIRFQEIAGMFESSLITPFAEATDRTLFHHNVSYTLWQCMHQCWEPEIYLQPLCHRFWKLTLQLLSRFSSWVWETYNTEILNETDPKQASTTTPAPGENLIMNKSLSSAAFEQPEEPELPTEPITMTQIVCLISDIQMLSVMLPDFFTDNVKLLMGDLGIKNTTFLEESLQESQDAITNQMPKFGEFIVKDITAQCLGYLKTVNDIPRLYRRTNRDVPSKPSGYVANVVKPIQTFLAEHESMISEETRKEWFTAILKNISEMYLSVTTDVLTSVKKMEESLKRLKKAKGSASGTGQGKSDDDKIRLQLYLDVQEFGKMIEALDIQKEDVETYGKLYDVVLVELG